MRIVWLHILLMLCCAAAFGQVPLDSIQRIDTVQVLELKTGMETVVLKFTSSGNAQTIDSTDKVYYQSTTLGEVVQENTGIYVKSYSPGALATSGFRGMGASQTKVFWNGIPMNSGMNGTIDLTNLPTVLFDNVGISFGGNSLIMGSGSLGGGIALSSQYPMEAPKFGGTAWYEVGSFGEHNTAVKLAGGKKKVHTKAGFVYRRSNNDFPFKNTTLFGEPVQNQEHAQFQQYAGLLEMYIDMKTDKLRNSRLSWLSFASKTDRNIPPTMLSANTFQSQYDWLAMTKLHWFAQTKRYHILSANVAYKFDEINFTSELPVIDSRSQTHSIIGQLRHSKFINDFQLSSHLEHTSQWAVTNNFDGVKHLPITAAVFNPEYRYQYDKVILSLILRQELIYKELSPFLPSFSIRYAPFRKRDFYLYSNIYRNYRYPTLNDRYWAQGGNPDLQQEKGWGAEGKMGYDKDFKKGIKLESSINAYYLDVHNWILWLPESSTGIWTPENVRRVKSRGLEALVKVDGGKGYWLYRFTANYHFNKATNETEGGSQGASTGKVLIYTPQHIANVSGMISYRGIYLQYRQHFCGKRYITSDNSEALPAFTTGDVRVGKNFKKIVPGLSIYFAIDNLWNAEYQNIAWRPMPGRSYSGGIRYEFAVK